jgi:hypothetical protein
VSNWISSAIDKIIDLYDAWQNGDKTVTTEGMTINIVPPGQPGNPAPTPTPPPLSPNAGKTVDEILTTKKGSITKVKLPKGTPSWNNIRGMTWEDVEKAAKAGRTGFKTIKKLLDREKYNR